MSNTESLKNSATLSQVSTILLSDLREEVFFANLSSFVKTESKEDQVEIYLIYNDESTRLIARDGEVVEGAQIIKKGMGASGYVARTKRIYFSNSVSSDPIFSTGNINDLVKSELILPILIDGNVLATIHLQSFDSEKKFSEKDASNIKDFLNLNMIALNNMNLYLMAKNLNKELLGKSENSENENHAKISTADSLTKIEMVGQDPELLKAISVARKAASQDVPLLIIGESGVGKRLLASKVHSIGKRSKCAYRIVECGVQNESSLEVALFGSGDFAGSLEQANGGTVILSDIHQLSMNLQTKVLDFLTRGVIQRVGSTEEVKLNVRLIVTSHRNLLRMVSEKKFRDDLFYRLATIQIELSPLSKRGEDVKILANHYLNYGKTEKKYLTNNALESLLGHDWEGNILELRNAMERTYVLTEGKYVDEVFIGHFGQEEQKQKTAAESTFEPVSLQDIEKKHICKTLEYLAGNKTRAAKSLGITVKTLYNKLHSYNLIETSNS
jgi:Nif-specific regulatory protein